MIASTHTLIHSDDANATRAALRDVLGWKHVAATNRLKLSATAKRLGVRWLATAFARRTRVGSRPAVFVSQRLESGSFAPLRRTHSKTPARSAHAPSEAREVLECFGS